VKSSPLIFVSHAHEDKPLARELFAGLVTRGYAVWIDDVELRIGDSLVERIADAISEGDFVVAIVSPDSLKSNWCKQELAWAATKGIADKRVVVLPIRYRGATMPATLADRLWADADQAGPGELVDQIDDAIQHHRVDDQGGSSRPKTPEPAGEVGLGASPFGRLDHVIWRDRATRTAAIDGWVLDPLDPNAIVEITILLDGEPLLTTNAERERPDVAQRFGVTSEHGFLVETTIPHAGTLSVRANTGRGAFVVDTKDVSAGEDS
jgi:hypothetical protein